MPQTTSPKDMDETELDAALTRLTHEKIGAGTTRRLVISTIIDRLLEEKFSRVERRSP